MSFKKINKKKAFQHLTNLKDWELLVKDPRWEPKCYFGMVAMKKKQFQPTPPHAHK